MKKNKKKSPPKNSQKFGKALLWVVLAVLILLIFFTACRRFFDEDELEAVHTTWKMNQGEEIYVDFFQHHNPLLYYILQPVVRSVSQNANGLITLRKIHSLVPIGIIILTYYLGALVFDKKVGLISAIILASSQTFINDAIEIRPDVSQTLFGILATLFLFIYFKKITQRRSFKPRIFLVLSAVSLGISFLFLQKAILIIFLIGLVFLERLVRKKIPWYDLFIFGGSFLLSLAPYFLYLAIKNQLNLYITLNWTLNSNFINSFPPWDTLRNVVQHDALLLVFYGLTFLIFVFAKKSTLPLETAFLSLGLFAYIFITPVPYPQYLLMAIPFMATIAAYGFVFLLTPSARNRSRSMLSKGWGLPILILLLAIFSSTSAYHVIWDKELKQSKQTDRIDFVLSATDPEDYVLDGDIYFNVFRRDIDYFWFSIKPYHSLDTYRQYIAPYNYDVYALIEEYKPMIISHTTVPNIKDEKITNNYSPTSYADLWIRHTN